MATIKKTALIKDYKTLRTKLRLNQTEFWNRLGVTQTCGSRYESGHTVPKSVAVLAYQAYIKGDPVDVREFK
jgi:DNA-binding transcriptional regulator YiaG